MNIFTVKLILSRSNPQVIRELQIEENRTIEDLQNIAKVLFLDDPEACESIVFRIDDRSVSPKLLLSHVLKDGLQAQLCLNTKTSQTKQLSLEVLSLQDTAVFNGPCINRFRPDCISASPYFANEAELKYTETLAKMNRNLIRLFYPDAIAPDLCKSIAIPLSRILDSHTVADLKDFAGRFGFSIPNGLRKASLIDTLCYNMNQDSYWEKLLFSLTYSEYQAMRTLCISGHLPDPSQNYWDVLPKLSDRSILAHDYSGVTRIAEEFMEFYDRWLNTHNEQQYLLQLCYRTVLNSACVLYGFVDRKLAEELMLHCYPEISQKTDLSDLWTTETEALRASMKKLNVSTVFNMQKFNRNDAEHLRSDFILRNRLHYIPDRSMLEFTASYGYRLEPSVEAEYRSLLSKNHCAYQRIVYSASELAYLTYFAYPSDQILAHCRDTLRLNASSPLLRELSRFLDKHEHDFRRLLLFGFTETELMSQSPKAVPAKKAAPAKKIKHVYPNDPCPCGSGKKYKLCCGRKS